MTPVTANPSSTAPALYQPATGELGINVNGGERMRITSGGNVGIGTTVEAGRLNINSTNSGGDSTALSLMNRGTANNTAVQISFRGLTAGGSENDYGYIKMVQTNTSTPASDLSFWTQSGTVSEKMRITSGGNVLIGTTTDVGGRLGVKSSGTNTSPFVIQRSANTNTLAAISETSAGDASFFLTNASGSTNIQLLSNGNSILNGGNVLIGTASDAGYTLNVVGNAQFIKSSTSTAMVVGLSGVTGSIIRFSYNGGFVGSISTDGSNTAYNTSSDYRLKEQVRPIDNPLEKVLKLNPVNFKYKNSKTIQDGFIAHEIQEILPYLVTGEKDGVEMQEVDYSKLTPILIAAIKEQQAQIQELKNKLS
jgi:hypothetical protein